MNELLKKPFLTNADIIELLQCSASKASRIKRIIKDDLKTQGKKVVTNEVPTSLFIRLMNLDINN